MREEQDRKAKRGPEGRGGEGSPEGPGEDPGAAGRRATREIAQPGLDRRFEHLDGVFLRIPVVCPPPGAIPRGSRRSARNPLSGPGRFPSGRRRHPRRPIPCPAAGPRRRPRGRCTPRESPRRRPGARPRGPRAFLPALVGAVEDDGVGRPQFFQGDLEGPGVGPARDVRRVDPLPERVVAVLRSRDPEHFLPDGVGLHHRCPDQGARMRAKTLLPVPMRSATRISVLPAGRAA